MHFSADMLYMLLLFSTSSGVKFKFVIQKTQHVTPWTPFYLVDE